MDQYSKGYKLNNAGPLSTSGCSKSLQPVLEVGRKSHIAVVLERLENDTTTAVEEVFKLESILAPILAIAQESPKEPKSPEEVTGVPLADRLLTLSNKIELIVSATKDITRRIEL